jgi:transposase-like protein
MSIENLSSEDNAMLRHVIEEGLRVTQQVEDLRGSLKDTVKAVAEELDIKPALITKAIRCAFKSTIDEDLETVNEVENILALVGRR